MYRKVYYIMNDQIKIMAIKFFVQKEIDLNEPTVIAAIISAAKGMALCSSTVTPENVIDAMINAFDVKENADAQRLIGMGPSFVSAIIGFSINFEDPMAASLNYNLQNGEYEALFSTIKEKILAEDANISR